MGSFFKCSLIAIFLFCGLALNSIAQAPTTTNIVPNNGSENLSIRETKQVVFTFNKDILEPSIEGGFKSIISISPAIDFAIVFTSSSANSLTITFSPDDLAFDTEYEIALDGISDTEDPANVAEEITTTFKIGKAVEVNNALTENICIGDPSGKELSSIVITENLADNFFSTTDEQEHRLILEVDEGFEFTDEGSLDFEENTDITNSSIEIIPANKRRLLIKYKLCSGDDCNPSSAHEDKITIKDVKVRTTNSNIPFAGATYEIKRVNAAENVNAVMPGLGAGTVFARLQVAESPPLVLTDLNTNTEITGNSLIICPRGQLAISAVSEWVLV